MSSPENNQTVHGGVDIYNIRSGIERYKESESSPKRDNSAKDHNNFMTLQSGQMEDLSRSLQGGSTEYFSISVQDDHGKDSSTSLQSGSTEVHSMTGQGGHGEDSGRSLQSGSTEDHSMTGQGGHEEDLGRSLQGGSTEDHSMIVQEGNEDDFSRSVRDGSTEDNSMAKQGSGEDDFSTSMIQDGAAEDQIITEQDGKEEDLSRSEQDSSAEDHSMSVEAGSEEDLSRSVQGGSTEYNSMSVGVESSTTLAVGNQTANLVASIGIKSRKDTQTPAIWGIAKVHRSYAVVTDHANKSVKVIDTKDSRVKSVKQIIDADFIWSITSVNDNQVAVTVGTGGVVNILFFSVSKSGIISGTDKMIGVDCCFDGMAFGNNCLYGTYAKAIHVISMQGQKIRTITSTSLGWLYGIALSNDQSTIYVTSYDNHKVISMDLEGMVKATTNWVSDIFQPCGITVDSLGYVYVCSNNKERVHQLSADLRKKQVIVENVDSKCCLFNNTENRLYLEFVDKLKVLDIC